MPSRTPITDRILDELQSMPGCDLDTLTKNLPDLSWSQIFLEVDRLSREGMVRVTFGLERRYTDPAAGVQARIRAPPHPALISEAVAGDRERNREK